MEPNPFSRLVRALLGLGYLAGAVYHLLNVTLWDPRATYASFADMAWWGWYETVIRDVVMPNATPFTVAVLLFELTVGLLILSRDGAARYGHLAGIAFNLALIPTMLAPYWIGNAVLIALHAVCLATRFQRPAPPRPLTRTGVRERELTRV